MDEHLADLERSGETLYDSRRHRLSFITGPQSQLSNNPVKGCIYEDLGATKFATTSTNGACRTAKESKGNRRGGYGSDQDEGSSPDELQLSSQGSLRRGSQKAELSTDGLEFHPQYLPRTLPKFIKNSQKDKLDSSEDSRDSAKSKGKSPSTAIAGPSKSHPKAVLKDNNMISPPSSKENESTPNGPSAKSIVRPRPHPAYKGSHEISGRPRSQGRFCASRQNLVDTESLNPVKPRPHPAEAIMTEKAGVTARKNKVQRKFQEIPLPSPLQKSQTQGFPELSPLSSSAGHKKSSSSSRPPCPLDSPTFQGSSHSQSSHVAASLSSDGMEQNDDDDADEMNLIPGRERLVGGGKYPSLEQQPMNKPKKPVSTSSNESVKRSSLVGDIEQGPSKRKRTVTALYPLDLADMTLTQVEERVDPSTLCPYCDEPFPSDPSPLLVNMLNRVRSMSYSDPRPYNSLGLKAPLTAFVSLCQRHRFESHQLPKAKRKGWPTRIDFAALPRRVAELKLPLEKVILEKASSHFWREVGEEIVKNGTRTVTGVRGQFASFEKSQPGYYGEQGSIIINQTLYNLFPPSSFNADLVAPLTPTEFIQRVLVPETAVALICQDLGIEKSEAIETLRDSSRYGVAMFPDLDKDEVGDEIVRERARVRRQEIEEEEEIERQMLGNVPATDTIAPTRPKRKYEKKTSKKESKQKARGRSEEARDHVPIVLTDSPSDCETLADRKGGDDGAAHQSLFKMKQIKAPDRLDDVKEVVDLDSDNDNTPQSASKAEKSRRAELEMRSRLKDRQSQKASEKDNTLSANACPLTMAKGRMLSKNSQADWRFNMRDQEADCDIIPSKSIPERPSNYSWLLDDDVFN